MSENLPFKVVRSLAQEERARDGQRYHNSAGEVRPCPRRVGWSVMPQPPPADAKTRSPQPQLVKKKPRPDARSPGLRGAEWREGNEGLWIHPAWLLARQRPSRD
jgi:hypothetical protein